MNEITKEELKTPAEWAELAGLELKDYDGFLRVYEKLTGVKDAELGATEYIMRRTEIIPDFILCTREAFDKALTFCSIMIPRDFDFGLSSEVVPNYSESALRKKLFGLMYLLQDIEKHGDVPEDSFYSKDELLIQLLKTLESYQTAIENNKRLNNVQEDKPLAEVKDSIYVKGKRIIQSAVKKGGTVEELEQKLIKKLIKSVEQVMNGKKEFSTISTSQIESLCALQNVSARAERHRAVSIEDLSFENPEYDDSKMRTHTFRVFDEKGNHVNVVAGSQDGLTLSVLASESGYKKAKAQKEAKRASMRAVVASVVEDCTQADLDEAKMIEDKQLQQEQEQDDQGNPGGGEL